MKVFNLFIITFLIYSCKGQNKNEVISAEIQNSSSIVKADLKPELVFNKTFYRVTKTDSIDILYHYCNASINTIKVYTDSIWEDLGQEDYTMLVDKINVDDKKIEFFGNSKQVTPEKYYYFEKENELIGYWKINNKTYIDSVKIKEIKQYKEPESECF